MKLLDTIKSKSRLLVMIDQVVFSGTSFVTTFVVAHLLAPAAFGVFAGFTLASYLIISICNALVIQPFQVSYPKADHPAAYGTFALSLQLALVATVALVLGALGNVDVTDIREFKPYVLPAVGMITTMLLHDFFRKAFLTQDKAFATVVMDTLMSALQLSGLALAFYASVHDLSSLLWIQTASFGIPTAYGAVVYGARPGMRYWSTYLPGQLAQAKWLVATAIIQWGSSNLFVVAAGVFLGPVALGAFRLVQSLFGVLNMLLQTYENYALPEAVRRLQISESKSKAYLRSLSLKGALWFTAVVTPLVLFPEYVMELAAGKEYTAYAFVVRGMALLYLVIIIGYPVRMAVRMLVVNHLFFTGYLLSFVFSLVTFNLFLRQWHLQGAIVGLIANQLILLLFWTYGLAKRKFLIWK